MDPATTVGAGLALLGSKDVLLKILGPSADYIGGEAKNLVEKCNINLSQVFSRAKDKLGPRLDVPGAVSARVLRHVYEDGRFAEDEIVVEYYSGLLAGSKTKDGRNDQALPYLSKVQQMSIYQLRFHFLFYYQLLKLHKSTGLKVALAPDCGKAGLVLSKEMFASSMPMSQDPSAYSKLAGHVFAGVSQQGLISSHYRAGDLSKVVHLFHNAPQRGFYAEPTFLGAELFMWALGIESPSGHDFFDLDIDCIEQVIPIHGFAVAKF